MKLLLGESYFIKFITGLITKVKKYSLSKTE